MTGLVGGSSPFERCCEGSGNLKYVVSGAETCEPASWGHVSRQQRAAKEDGHEHRVLWPRGVLTIRSSTPSLQRISLTCTLDMCTCTDRDLEMHRTTTFGSRIALRKTFLHLCIHAHRLSNGAQQVVFFVWYAVFFTVEQRLSLASSARGPHAQQSFSGVTTPSLMSVGPGI